VGCIAFAAAAGRSCPARSAQSHACLECGLTWNEVDPYELRRNLRDYGVVPHGTGVMEVVQGKRVDVAL